MQLRSAIANGAWVASALPAWRRFRRTLDNPDAVQSGVLKEIASCCQGTAVWPGRFEAIEPRDWSGIAPFVERAAAGEPNVVSRQPVTHFEPTSGSSAAVKLIPSTALLRRQFNRAVRAWIADLYLHRPSLVGGPSYWSISPAVKHPPTTAGIRVGYEDDSEYLGRLGRLLVSQTLAVPAGVRHLDADDFRRATLLCLMAQAELRLISVWNPTFLASMLEFHDEHRDSLWRDLERGIEICGRRLRRRRTERLWPKLQLLSCWADGHAATQLQPLRDRFPDVCLQAKGLLATEAFVSIPFQDSKVVASSSHYFEFLTPDQKLLRLSQLREGDEVAVVVTTGGGLIRYRLGDRVIVTGKLGQTPCIDFLGRESVVSDLCGEKLSEAFVGAVIAALAGDGFSMLVPDTDRYVLFTTSSVAATELDRRLSENFQYAWALQVGQLKGAKVVRVNDDASALYVDTCERRGKKRGDIKPVALDLWNGWHAVFREIAFE